MATESNNLFDLVILDHNLPPYLNKEINSGTNIAILLRESIHSSKIIIITSHTEVLIVYDIIKKVKPEGIAIKNDITDSTFGAMLTSVFNGDVYQSPFVKFCINQIWKKEIMVEEKNRQILIYLSKGYKANEIGTILNLAPRTIERRMGEIRRAFEVSDNISLIHIAVQRGFI